MKTYYYGILPGNTSLGQEISFNDWKCQICGVSFSIFICNLNKVNHGFDAFRPTLVYHLNAKINLLFN